MTTPRLEARGASKTFGSATVLSGASLVVQPGEIHALVGQNGSGKSTLVKILTGYHAPDAGMTLAVDGQALSLPVHWRAAQAAGVSVVHQDLGLLDHLTVSENIGIGGFVHSRVTGRIDWRRQDRVRRGGPAAARPPGVAAGPGRRALAAHRAGVAIARALRATVPGRGPDDPGRGDPRPAAATTWPASTPCSAGSSTPARRC